MKEEKEIRRSLCWLCDTGKLKVFAKNVLKKRRKHIETIRKEERGQNEKRKNNKH